MPKSAILVTVVLRPARYSSSVEPFGLHALARHRRVWRAGPTRLPDSRPRRQRIRCHILVAIRVRITHDRLHQRPSNNALLFPLRERSASRRPFCPPSLVACDSFKVVRNRPVGDGGLRQLPGDRNCLLCGRRGLRGIVVPRYECRASQDSKRSIA